MTRNSGKSSHWRQRQGQDSYVDRASREDARSRAYFKLEQIHSKEGILEAGMSCVDLGSSPGGWSQYAGQAVGPRGKIWAVDLAPMTPIPGVEFLCGDFTSESTQRELEKVLGGDRVDLVMSDLAPNITGNRAVDQPRSMALAEEALAFAEISLRPGGSFLVKLFQGDGFEDFVSLTRLRFGTVKLIKPPASRPESREMYLLARNYGM